MNVLVCGAGGFIGHHLVKKLKQEGNHVIGIDLRIPSFSNTFADEFVVDDLRSQDICKEFTKGIDEVYQLAADMGGAGFIFTGENDANVMYNSTMVNLNIGNCCIENRVKKLFFSSSACVYPYFNQLLPDNPHCVEDSVYPANPDSEYGWEKLFAERFYHACRKNYGLDVRIARFHNIFGPESEWRGGREKAPAALCRKVASANDGDEIEIWGDGEQSRSFLHISECLEGIDRLMKSNFTGIVNIGSSEMITINDLARMIIEISGKRLEIKNISGPEGVRGRTSDNTLIRKALCWSPSKPLYDGIVELYQWVESKLK